MGELAEKIQKAFLPEVQITASMVKLTDHQDGTIFPGGVKSPQWKWVPKSARVRLPTGWIGTIETGNFGKEIWVDVTYPPEVDLFYWLTGLPDHKYNKKFLARTFSYMACVDPTEELTDPNFNRDRFVGELPYLCRLKNRNVCEAVRPGCKSPEDVAVDARFARNRPGGEPPSIKGIVASWETGECTKGRKNPAGMYSIWCYAPRKDKPFTFGEITGRLKAIAEGYLYYAAASGLAILIFLTAWNVYTDIALGAIAVGLLSKGAATVFKRFKALSANYVNSI
ncbi:MAG: hypothetical protein ACP5QG_09275, partial [candidate division WOR-3 bacterium]